MEKMNNFLKLLNLKFSESIKIKIINVLCWFRLFNHKSNFFEIYNSKFSVIIKYIYIYFLNYSI